MFYRRGDKVSEEKASRNKGKTKEKQAEYGCVPGKFWYSFFGECIALPVLKLRFGIKVKPDNKIKALEGPLVIVGNHPSYIDPVIMAATLRGRPINFVAGEFLFRKKIFGPIITRGGCIPKAQFRNDLRTVRAMMKVLGRNGVLGIFPEGTRFTDGHSIGFDTGLASLVKKTNSSVVIFRSHGAYMTWPRWSQSSYRKGRITAEFTDVLPKEKVAEMTVDEIHQYMRKALVYNEYEYFASHPQEFRSKAIASGVQNIANICPKCESLNSVFVTDASSIPGLKGKKNLLSCSCCGNKVLMNKYGFFEPVSSEDKCFPDLHKWNVWEQEQYKKMVAEPGFVLTEKVSLFELCDGRYQAKVGEGVLTVKDKTVTYEGTECAPEEGIIYKKGKPVKKFAQRDISKVAKPVTKTFQIHGMKGMLMDYGKFMELFSPSCGAARFVPENIQRLYEIQSVIMAMKDQIDP